MKKVALITGANRGLGLALAEVFRPHYGLILHSRNRDEDLRERFPDAGFLVGDLTHSMNFTGWKGKLEGVRLSAVVNNAGVYFNRGMDELEPQHIFTVVETNLVAPMLMVKMVWPLLEHGAVVVNVSSLAADSPGPGEAVYAASKAGLSAFTAGLQFDATARGVQVVDVRLGALKTAMSSDRGDWAKHIEPIEAADAILALCRGYTTLRITGIEIKRRLY